MLQGALRLGTCGTSAAHRLPVHGLAGLDVVAGAVGADGYELLWRAGAIAGARVGAVHVGGDVVNTAVAGALDLVWHIWLQWRGCTATASRRILLARRPSNRACISAASYPAALWPCLDQGGTRSWHSKMRSAGSCSRATGGNLWKMSAAGLVLVFCSTKGRPGPSETSGMLS